MSPLALRVFSGRMSSSWERNGASACATHLVGAPEAVEVVHVQRAQVHLQRLEHVRELDVLALGLDAVDVDVELRHVDLVGAEGAAQRRVLVGLAERLGQRR